MANPTRIVLVYPDLLGTYGDRGNAIVLHQRLVRRGLPAELVTVAAGEAVPSDGDLYVIGGAEDSAQILAVRMLTDDGALQRAAGRGATIFAVCAGFQLCGESFPAGDGSQHEGLGLINVTTRRGDQRTVGEIVLRTEHLIPGSLAALPTGELLSGFENHGGLTTNGPGVAPLGRRIVAGHPSGDTEGAVSGHVVGTYLHGPALTRNPALADALLTMTVGRDLQPLAVPYVDRLRGERLAAAGAKVAESSPVKDR